MYSTHGLYVKHRAGIYHLYCDVIEINRYVRSPTYYISFYRDYIVHVVHITLYINSIKKNREETKNGIH